MSYTRAGVYRPDRWTISSHDDVNVEPRQGNANPTGNTAWVANLAVAVPFVLASPAIVYEWFHFNGTLTTAYNVDYGIYNPDFTKVQSLGSTAGTVTASAFVNTTAWTDLTLLPGQYYMAFWSDSTRNFTTSIDAIGQYQSQGIVEQVVATNLPSPLVPVAYTRAFAPVFGINLRSIAI